MAWKPCSRLVLVAQFLTWCIRYCISCGQSARVREVTWHWGRLDVWCLGSCLCMAPMSPSGLHTSSLPSLPSSWQADDYANFPDQTLKMSLLFSIQAFGATPFGFSDHLCDIRRRRISVTALAKLLISFAAKDALSRCRSRRGSLASFLSASELHSISYEYKYGPLLQGGLDFGPLTRLHEIQSLWVWV